MAQEFGVRRETIYRDLQALESLGFPLVGDEVGRWTRISLDPTFPVPPVGLTEREGAALMWALGQVKRGQPFGDVLPQLRRKIESLSRQKGRALVEGFQEALGTGGPGRTVREISASLVERLVEAIAMRRRASVDYEPPGRSAGPIRLRFEPYRLRLVQGALYCVGRVADGASAARGGPMTSLGDESAPGTPGGSSDLTVLSVHRITAVELMKEQFVVARGFDPARYDAQVFGVLGGPPETVVIRFGPNVAPHIRAREWHPSQKLRDLADGHLELTFRAGGAHEIVRWVIGWGAAAEVVRPLELRHRVATALSAAAAMYRVVPAPEARKLPAATRASRSRSR